MATGDSWVCALGYIRVSTTDQAEHGQGLKIQREISRRSARSSPSLARDPR